MGEPDVPIDTYLVEFDNGLLLASIVATAAVEMESEGKLTFPLNAAADLHPVCDRALTGGRVAEDEKSRDEFQSMVLDGWSESSFPITSKYDLAWSIVEKYRLWQLGDRLPDPRVVIGRIPPRRPWPGR
jgi:hypothetical protein